MKITVTRDHIEQGKCKLPHKCMIAMAIKDEFPDVSYVSVRTNGITITKKKGNGESVRQHWSVPLKAARAIIRFDAEGIVAPFSFEPKLIDEKAIQPVSATKRASDHTRTRQRRSKLKAEGKPEPKYGRERIAGV